MPCLRIIYEDDLYTSDRQQHAMRRIVNWLGLEYEPLHSDLVRNTPEGLTDLVRNYEAMAASLAGTEFERFVYE